MPETASPATSALLCWDLARGSARLDRECSINTRSERPFIALHSCSQGTTAENSKTQMIQFSGLRAVRGTHT